MKIESLEIPVTLVFDSKLIGESVLDEERQKLLQALVAKEVANLMPSIIKTVKREVLHSIMEDIRRHQGGDRSVVNYTGNVNSD